MDRMKKEELIELIESMNISKDDFVILSSSQLVLRGILDDAGDLDIAVTKKGLEDLGKQYDLVLKDNGFYKVSDKIECVLDDMCKKELVDGYYLQDINEYLEYLESSEREKDKKRIPLVKEYISKKG